MKWKGMIQLSLEGKRILMLLGPQYQDEEAKEPLEFLLGQGARVDVVGLEKGKLKGLHGREEIEVNMTPDEVDTADYDALVIPGGRGPANLREHHETVDLVRDYAATGRPIAAICHGPQMLAAADLLKGKTITGYHKIKEEMIAAGANFVDAPVVKEGNFIFSRQPSDIPEFDRAIEEALT
jgi:protease I